MRLRLLDLLVIAAACPSNVLAGARYLRLMLERFHSTDLALAAYNAGRRQSPGQVGRPAPRCSRTSPT